MVVPCVLSSTMSGPLLVELRCRHPAALFHSTHEHRHAKGHMKVACEKGWKSVPEHTGKYTPEIGAVYAKCVSRFVRSVQVPKTHIKTQLVKLAEAADLDGLRTGDSNRAGGRATHQYMLCPKVGCIDLVGDEHLASALMQRESCTTSSAAAVPRGLGASMSSQFARM